jgi:hypothetical protein
MAAVTLPPEARPDLWGPTLLSGFYIYKGEKDLIPTTWKNVSKMMENLKYIEQFEYAYALPEQRQALFNKQLEVLTRDLPIDWRMVILAVTSGIIIFIAVASTVKSQIAKL